MESIHGTITRNCGGKLSIVYSFEMKGQDYFLAMGGEDSDSAQRQTVCFDSFGKTVIIATHGDKPEADIIDVSDWETVPKEKKEIVSNLVLEFKGAAKKQTDMSIEFAGSVDEKTEK